MARCVWPAWRPPIGIPSAVDLWRDPPTRGRWLSPPVVDAMKATFGGRRTDPAVLNRRGYAPINLRRACGHVDWNVRNARPGWSSIASAAPWSAIIAVMPRRRPRPASIAARSISSWPAVPGVERLAEEAAELFPRHGSSFSHRTKLLMNRVEAEAAVERMQINGEIDILIGTQMAAKGHQFPESDSSR